MNRFHLTKPNYTSVKWYDTNILPRERFNTDNASHGTWSERTRVQTPPDQNVPGSVKTYPGARRNVPAPT